MMRELVPVERPDIVEGEWSPAGPPALAFSLEELVERFLASHDVRSNSRSTYRRQLREFGKWLETEGLQLTELRREHILAYRGYLESRAGASGHGLSSYSVAGYLTAVRRLFTWLEAERLYPNVARSVKGPKRPRGYKKDTLTEDQLRACLEAIERDSSLGEYERVRNYALFNLMARTGLRDVEAARASYGDIRRLEGERVLYVHGKGRDEADEFVLLTSKAYKPLRAYLEKRPHVWEGSPLFVSHSRRNYGERLTSRSISRIVKNTLRAAGLDDRRLTAHSLRHTAISIAIRNGASLEQAQAMARHGSPATTMIYYHNLERVTKGAEKYIDF